MGVVVLQKASAERIVKINFIVAHDPLSKSRVRGPPVDPHAPLRGISHNRKLGISSPSRLTKLIFNETRQSSLEFQDLGSIVLRQGYPRLPPRCGSGPEHPVAKSRS